jgi:hypothetical protein
VNTLSLQLPAPFKDIFTRNLFLLILETFDQNNMSSILNEGVETAADNIDSTSDVDEVAELPNNSTPNTYGNTRKGPRRASSRLRQVLGNETSYEAIMNYMKLSKKSRMDALASEEEAKASASKFYNSNNNSRLENSDTESVTSISSRSHARAQNKLNSAILSVQRRTEREILPKLERLTATAASTIHLGREVEIAFQNELIKAETWGKNDAKASTSSSMDIHLLQSLCKSICKKDGRDALLEYVIQAIEDVELVDTNNYSDNEVQSNSDDQ